MTRTGPSPYVFVAIVGVFTGRDILASIFAPLSREMGLTIWQVGLILSSSSLTVILASSFWGRRVAAWGYRRVLLVSVFGAAGALLGFAVVAHLAVLGVLPAALTFGLAVVFRSVLYGGTGGATPIATQSYVVSVTADQAARVKAFAAVGASFAVAGIGGPALGGLLAIRSLLLPLYVPPLILVAAGVLLWKKLQPAQAAPAPTTKHPRLSPLDSRLWPYLLIGFTLFTTLTMQAVLVGFVLQDRLHLTPEATARRAGIAFLCSGACSLIAQLFLVRRLAWPPAWLLRAGLPVSLTGFVLLISAHQFALVVLATSLIGLGHALAIPGFSAGPTLAVDDHEQGGLAGLMSASNGVAAITGPLAATTLYALSGPTPYILGATLLLTALLLTLRLPTRLRS